MTDDNLLTDPTTELPKLTAEDRLKKLKKTADNMGLKYSHQIGPDALSKKINDVLDGKQDDETLAEAEAQIKAAEKIDLSNVTTDTRVIRLKEAQRLMLVKIVCMNPSKREWDGEIITVGNSVVGTYRKFVKFNADRGWYIPKIMYNVLLSRKCQLFKTVKIGGRKVRQGYQVPEFAISVLPNQSRKELDAEAFKQAAQKAAES